MSQEKIITQPLGDPVGSIYEVDGKCYIKTSNASGTMNTMVQNPVTQKRANSAEQDLVKCETGAGARQATVSSGGGGHACWGDARSLDNINYAPRNDENDWWLWESWMLNYSAPGGTEGPRGQGIDHTTIPRHQWLSLIGSTGTSTRTTPDPSLTDFSGNNLSYWYSMRLCLHHRGYVKFTPASVIRGFDEFLFWGTARMPFNRPAGYWQLSAQHAETDEWHVITTWTGTWFRRWLGYMLGYTEEQAMSTRYINVRAYALYGRLHPYVHLTPRNDNPEFQVDPKFHDMPIKSVTITHATGTKKTWSTEFHTLQMYKNGEKINLMDNSIVLRSAEPTKAYV